LQLIQVPLLPGEDVDADEDGPPDMAENA